ncbi:MAG: ABC transporter permease [Bacteroidales bacterium]|jgi:ABC-type lipoprotein release transport system permease subunit|nr:ABC transporter permease [Bacteroidales bacterium]MDX9927957.1 FtsX-like permease family protein [Bacteroidales bacterium]HNX83243.1 FtsX-like permease family protein [Bacteroidales bacterium]HOC48515.1 FtsX-like permease family protein [Bacteroidales bacterium]HPS97541.1 FtsX-like permease family protein [Bacteroidales bacterium]
MITSIAWKNVWRNRTRSLTVIAAVTVGVFASVFALAAINSSIVQRIDSAVNEELSHIQVNTKEFRSSSDILNIISEPDKVAETLRKTPGVTDVTGRIIVRGIASAPSGSAGVEITGIDIEKEKQMFTLSGKLIPGTGSYFGADTKLNSAFIGEKLARELQIIRYILTAESLTALVDKGVPSAVTDRLKPLEGQRFTTEKKLTEAYYRLLTPKEIKKYGLAIREAAWSYREGSRVILSFLDVNGNQTGAAYRICGIFRTNNDLFEATSVFVPMEELRRLTGLEDGVYHRFIARLEENDMTDRVTPVLKEALPGLEVMNWKEIQVDLAMIADYINQIYAIFMVLILAALSFGIVNTMLMAVLERTRELGMLSAVGMNRRRIFLMIMLESVFLSVVGGFTGMAVSGIVIGITNHTGINLVKYSEGLEAFGYSAHLYPTIGADFFIILTVLIVITGILSAVYPARKALQLNPVEALRGE